MQGKPVSQKIIAIDLLRALAALGVFYYHSQLGTTLARYSGLSWLTMTDGFGIIYAVPLFFLVSGYCIHTSNIKYLKANKSLPLEEYYRRRFLRIYPAYLVALLVAIGVNYIVDDNYRLNLYDGLIHLFSLQGFTTHYFNTINLALWTISVELAFYAIYPIFYYIRFRFNLKYALAFTFLVSCLSITYYTVRGSFTPPERFCAFNLWFAWCCGAFLADKKMLSPHDLKRPVYLFFYLLIITGLIWLNFIRPDLSILIDQFNILFWAAPMMFLLSKEEWLRRKQNLWIIKILAAIGLSSYSLYLLHEPLTFLKNLLVHEYFPPSLQLAGVTAGILLIPVISWCSYYYVEKPFLHKKTR